MPFAAVVSDSWRMCQICNSFTTCWTWKSLCAWPKSIVLDSALGTRCKNDFTRSVSPAFRPLPIFLCSTLTTSDSWLAIFDWLEKFCLQSIEPWDWSKRTHALKGTTHTHQHALTYTKATNLLEKTKNREKQEDRRKWAIYDQMRGKILHHCRTSHNRLIHPRNKKLRLSF